MGNFNANIGSDFRKELFDRDWRVRISLENSIGTGLARALDISELDMTWEVEKSLKAEPNKCKLEIFNLGEDSRHALENLNLYDPKRAKGVPRPRGNEAKGSPKAPKTGLIRVEIEAGYKATGRTLIFRGDLRRALSEQKHDKTWVTTIEGEDGGRSVLSSRVTESFPKGTPRRIVVEKCAAAMGLGLGNILEVESLLSQTYTGGTVLDGPAATELSGVLRRAGIVYSIQDGNLQFLQTGKGLRVKAVLLDAYSGLVDSPERDTQGLVKATTLVNPDVVVGGFVYLDSRDLKGTFRVTKVTCECTTFGRDWYQHLELKAG